MEAKQQHPSPCAPWLQTQCDPVPHTPVPAPSLAWWTVSSNREAKQTLPSEADFARHLLQQWDTGPSHLNLLTTGMRGMHRQGQASSYFPSGKPQIAVWIWNIPGRWWQLCSGPLGVCPWRGAAEFWVFSSLPSHDELLSCFLHHTFSPLSRAKK